MIKHLSLLTGLDLSLNHTHIHIFICIILYLKPVYYNRILALSVFHIILSIFKSPGWVTVMFSCAYITFVSQCFPPPRVVNVYQQTITRRNVGGGGEHPFQEGVAVLFVASCH